MAELGILLLEAVVGVALDRVFNPHDNSELMSEIHSLKTCVIGLQHQVHSLDALIKNVTDNVPDEVHRFRRIREKAHSHLGHLDPTLIDFAAELVASLLYSHALGFQLKVHASKKALHRGRAFETRDFEVVLAASKTVVQNMLLLKDFFNGITQYVDFQSMSKLEKPAITLNMVCGSTVDYRTLELMRYRIALRLVTLNAMALGWNTSCTGRLELNGVLISNHDDSMYKFVNNTEMDSRVQVENFPRAFWSDEYKKLTNLLRNTVQASVSCFKVLILSFDSWAMNEVAEHHGFSPKIRTFVSGGTVRCVEVKMKDFSHWDHINLEQVLFWGLSMSVVVFRFATLEQLSLMLEASTQITLKYPGLMDDVTRVLFVETSSTDNVGHLRQNIVRTACVKRLAQPRDEEDILFEKSYASAEEMMEYITKRGESVKSIINDDVAGESRDLMISIARIFNREVTMAEAIDEGEAVIKFALNITERVASSSVCLHKDDNEITLSNGDQNSGFLPQKVHHIYDNDYVDFRRVPRRSSANLQLNVRVYGIAHLLSYSWFRKRRAVDDFLNLVRNQKLFIAVVCEEKKTFKRSSYGSAGPIVSSVSIRAMGGCDWNDYLHARLQKCILQIVKLREKKLGWTALRVLLRLLPGLSEFCKRPEPGRISSYSCHSSSRAGTDMLSHDVSSLHRFLSFDELRRGESHVIHYFQTN